MKLKSLSLINYKSINKCNIDFNNKSIILGANASGKSNFISSMKFLNYILMYGIEDAVSLMGGIDNLININAGPNENLEISFSITLDNHNWYRRLNKNYEMNPDQIDYLFRIEKRRNNQYRIIHDELRVLFILQERNNRNKDRDKQEKPIGSFIMNFIKNNNKINSSISNNSSNISDDELKKKESFRFFSIVMGLAKKELMLNNIRYILPPIYFSNNEIFKIYDFDPKLLKTPSQITSKRNLEEDGSNIGVVLESLLRDKADREKLFNLLKSCLPNIQSVEIKKSIDKSVSYQMKETYFNKPLYSQFLSDGTVSMLALVIALYFNDEENIIVLEEPERNLHPKVIRKLVEMLNEVSESKQIIITTHNSEVVKNSDIDDVVCIKREKDGISQISKPLDNERIKVFLQNELGLEDLFLDGII